LTLSYKYYGRLILKFETKMPILVRDFTWTQSESIICINLPLKGTKVTNLDVLNSSEFCKVINIKWII